MRNFLKLAVRFVVLKVTRMSSDLFLRKLFKYALVCMPVFAVSSSQGQAPLVNDQSNYLGAEQSLVFEWKTDAADRLLKSGLAVLAEDVYRDLYWKAFPKITEQMLTTCILQLVCTATGEELIKLC